MPISEPQKVRISPKAVNTLTSISPVGGTQKAEKISCAPKKTKAAESHSWKFAFFLIGLKKEGASCMYVIHPQEAK